MSRPIAVCISDIHFNLSTLELASKALKAAISKAEELGVPLVVAGDLHDTKAIIRAEVANTLIDIFKETDVHCHVLVGNHDLINEKNVDHGLNYLSPYVDVVSSTRSCLDCGLNFVPYQTSSEEFLKQINRHDSIVICHQGFKGACMGDYVQDKTSVDPELVKDFRVISGHYHRHQTIGTVTYIGSPFTTSFGEASDGDKGFIVLNEDGTFTREILNLRKHVILEGTMVGGEIDFSLCDLTKINPEDLLWVKIRGPRSMLNILDKKAIGVHLIGHSNFKLDLIPEESNMVTNESKDAPKMVTESERLDKIIDKESETEEQKRYLKSLWRELV